MEKLQPVIKQMFWILFGLALILILWGWWAANGALSDSVEAGKAKVETSYRDVKQDVSAVPNSKWTEGAKKENAQHELAYNESARDLWKQQLAARVYPGKISRELSDLDFGGSIAREVRGEFAKLYRTYFNEQLKTISPFLQGDGLIEVNYGGITQEDESRWKTKPPTSPEIWDAQEDIWLLRSIYDAIATVNAGAANIEKATIRSLQQLELRGGDPDAEPGSTGGGAGGFASGGGGGDGYDDGDSGMMSGGMSGGFGGGAAGSQPWSKYQGSLGADLLVEEFGQAAAGGTGGAVMGGMASSMGSGGYDDGGYESSGGGFGGTPAAAKKRYVDEAEELPYKTRAFILQVRMVQQRIPSLLAALTNSSFPVEIVRVDASFGSPLSQSAGGLGGGYPGSGSGEGDSYEGGSSGAGSMSPQFGGGGSAFGGGPAFGGGSAFGGGPAFGGGGASFGGQTRGMGIGTGGGRGKVKRPDPRKSGFYGRAMADPNLSTVRVAGLMTLYEPDEEKEAKAEADQAAETEAQDKAGVDIPDVPELGSGEEAMNENGENSDEAATSDDAAGGQPVPQTGTEADAAGTAPSGEAPATVSPEPATSDGSPSEPNSAPDGNEAGSPANPPSPAGN